MKRKILFNALIVSGIFYFLIFLPSLGADEIPALQQHIQIEAKIIRIDLDEEHFTGVDWEAIVSDYQSLDLKSSTAKTQRLGMGTISNEDASVLLDALDTVGETQVLSSPTLAVADNQEARILAGSMEPQSTTTVTTPFFGSTTIDEHTGVVDVWVKLFLTPTLKSDQSMAMKIRPQISSVLGHDARNPSEATVDTSQGESVMTIKEGMTIVLGGLIKEDKINTVKKFPFFGDLPILGAAFRNQNRSIRKTELVVFLTPTVVGGGSK